MFNGFLRLYREVYITLIVIERLENTSNLFFPEKILHYIILINYNIFIYICFNAYVDVITWILTMLSNIVDKWFSNKILNYKRKHLQVIIYVLRIKQL